MNNSLYSISNELSEFDQAISEVMDSDDYTPEQKDEITSVIFANYLSVEERFDERVDFLAADSKRLKAQADACKAEAKRISQIAATYEAQAERNRQVILDAMQQHNKSKVEGTFCKLSIRKNAPKLVIDLPIDKLPTLFVNEKIIKEVDKEAIKEHLAARPETHIAHYEQTQSLVIK
jgi:chaperonin cofactor prefoldin